MQNETMQSMHDQVRAIYRAFTGEEVGETESGSDASHDIEGITRRFAELENIARTFSSVMDRLPTVTFTPPLDVLAGDDAVVIEVSVPGVDRDEIAIERTATAIVISGIRESPTPSGRLFHAELPRGPFYRSIPLPFPIDHDPQVELDRGVLRIFLTLAASARALTTHAKSEANETNTSGDGNDEDGDH